MADSPSGSQPPRLPTIEDTGGPAGRENATGPDLLDFSASFNEELPQLIEMLRGNDPDQMALVLANLTGKKQSELIEKLVEGIFLSIQCEPQKYPVCFRACIEYGIRTRIINRQTLRSADGLGSILRALRYIDTRTTVNDLKTSDYCIPAPDLVVMLISLLLHNSMPHGLAIGRLIDKHELMLKLPSAIKRYNRFSDTKILHLSHEAYNIPALMITIVTTNDRSCGFQSLSNIPQFEHQGQQTISRKEMLERHNEFFASLKILGTLKEMTEKETKLRQILNTNTVKVIPPIVRDGIRLFTRLFAPDLDSIITDACDLDMEEFSWHTIIAVPLCDQASDQPLTHIRERLQGVAMSAGKTDAEKLFLLFCIHKLKTYEGFRHTLLGQVTDAMAAPKTARQNKGLGRPGQRRRGGALALAIHLLRGMENSPLLEVYKDLLRNLKPEPEVAEDE